MENQQFENLYQSSSKLYRTICFTVIILCSSILHATTYYVDDDGDDANSGTLSSPFRTIQRASDMMQAGDICYIRSGVYRETVIPGAGETFANYNGEYVLISGSDIITGTWSADGNGVYKTSFSEKVLQVYVDGERMYIARFPDENGNELDLVEWNDITLNYVNGSTATVNFDGQNWSNNYWQGAYYTGLATHENSNAYRTSVGRVTSSSGNTLTLTELTYFNSWNNTKWYGDGKGYIINHRNALTSQSEWFWGDNMLYVKSPDGGNPSEKFVEARTRLYAFDISVNNVIITGLNFKGASVRIRGNNSTIENNTFRYHVPWTASYIPNGDGLDGYWDNQEDGSAGIYIDGTNNSFVKNYVGHYWGAGIQLRGSANFVEDNFFEDGNWRGGDGNAISTVGADQTITYNTCRNFAGRPINAGQISSTTGLTKRLTLTHNDLSGAGWLLYDGGPSGIYVGNTEGPTENRGTDGSVVAYNLVYRPMHHTGKAFAGIYCDDGTDDIIVHHNVVHGNGQYAHAILFNGSNSDHTPEDIYVYNNTAWGYRDYGILTYYPRQDESQVSVTYKNNHFEGDYSAGSVTEQDKNRSNVPASEIVNTSATNPDFRLTEGSASINAGVAIAGITDGFSGSAPDLGAYEYGVEAWTAGSSIDPNIDFCDENPDGCDNGGGNQPNPPTGLTATATSSSQINLAWADNSDDETSFKIERKTGSGNYSQIATVSANVISYSNTGLAASTTYTYRVRASNADGNSGFTNESSATTQPGSTGGTELSFIAVADANVNSAAPSTNYGNLTSISVQQSASRSYEAYIRFDLEGISVNTIIRAILKLRESPNGTSNNDNSELSVRRVSGSWEESLITWNNKPTYENDAMGSYAANAIDQDETIEIELTAGAFTDDGLFDLVVRGITNGNDVPFYSRETSVAPELILTLEESSGDCVTDGSITYQKWENITGSKLSSLFSAPDYPSNPSAITELSSMEAPTNVGDNYGARIVGTICTPETGQYYFWVAGDDETQLWLSSDEYESGKNLIAYHESWTSSRQWNKFSTQKSSGITLQAGQKYYIEAVMKEAQGGDNLAVGWRKPIDGDGSSPSEVVPGSVLSNYSPGDGSGSDNSTITIHARGNCGGTNGSESMRLLVNDEIVKAWDEQVSSSFSDYTYEDYSGGNIKVEFYKDGNGGCDRNLIVDYITVDGTVFQAESQVVNTAVWDNGCGNGSYSQWMHCNGYIDFGDLSGARLAPLFSDESELITIYPNPTSGELYLNITESSFTVDILDLSGKLMISLKNSSEIDISALPTGLYTIRIITDESTTYQKVVKY